MNTSDFLLSLNTDLKALQAQLEQATAKTEDHATIFILGLPRSGTSLLCQTIFSSMTVACTNNLMARFWKAPLVGGKLSGILQGERRETTFASQFGSTELPWEPHEFSWFWHDLLNLRVDGAGVLYAEEKDIDWPRVKKVLCQLSNLSALPYVHKPLEILAQYMGKFVQTFERAVFVYIDRDPLDVAVSLANVRKSRNGDLNSWWGSYPSPEEFRRLEGAPFNLQIAGQVTFLRNLYAKKLPEIPPDRFVSTDYLSFCNDPMSVLQDIQVKANGLGCDIPILAAPGPFEGPSRPAGGDLQEALKSGFRTMESWGYGT